MMSPQGRCGAVVAFLVCVVACEDSAPTSPSRFSLPPPPAAPAPPYPPPPPTPPRTPITFPPLSGPSRTFVFDHELTYPVRPFTKQSRFVLFDNGAFVLEYLSIPAFTPSGQYRPTDGVLMFLFEGAGRYVDEAWDDAVGTLQGDSLTIEFEEQMQHSDYENAVYVLSR